MAFKIKNGKQQSLPQKKRLGNLLPGITGDEAVTMAQFDPTSATVTQITSITTGVTISAKKGIITTVAATAGAAGATPNVFTVTNSSATAASFITASIMDYAGTIATNGNPVVIVDNRIAGAFDLVISNLHGTNALNGVLQIGYEIKN